MIKDRMTKIFKSMGIHVTDPKITADQDLFQDITEDHPLINLQRILDSMPWRKKKFIQPNPDRSKVITTNDFDPDLNFIRKIEDPEIEDPKSVKVDTPKPKSKPKKETPRERIARLEQEIALLEDREKESQILKKM